MKILLFIALVLASCGCVTESELTQCKVEYQHLMQVCSELYMTLEYVIQQCPAEDGSINWLDTY